MSVFKRRRFSGRNHPALRPLALQVRWSCKGGISDPALRTGWPAWGLGTIGKAHPDLLDILLQVIDPGERCAETVNVGEPGTTNVFRPAPIEIPSGIDIMA